MLVDEVGHRPKISAYVGDNLEEWLYLIGRGEGVDTCPAIIARYFARPDVVVRTAARRRADHARARGAPRGPAADHRRVCRVGGGDRRQRHAQPGHRLRGAESKEADDPATRSGAAAQRPAAEPPHPLELIDRERVLELLTQHLSSAWASFDRPRPQEPELDPALIERLIGAPAGLPRGSRGVAGRHRQRARRERLAGAAPLYRLHRLHGARSRSAGRGARQRLRRQPGRRRGRGRDAGEPDPPLGGRVRWLIRCRTAPSPAAA